MMAFFSNPWVVGVGTCVIGGVVVAVIKRIFFSPRDNKKSEKTTPKEISSPKAACVIWNYPSRRLTDIFSRKKI